MTRMMFLVEGGREGDTSASVAFFDDGVFHFLGA